MNQIATFAAGCFWCTEAVFDEVRGVQSVISGYTGGTMPDPSYDDIHTADTGHAEAVQVTYDPLVISYETLVKIFFGTHDPTQLNRQGNDVGKEYRSAIFYHTDEQKNTAQKIKDQLESEGLFDRPIITTIEPYTDFYEAEPEHQDFYKNNPDQPYCQAIIDPKMSKFRQQYQHYIK